MIDSVQLILLLVIVTLTLLLIVLGVQVFYILRDLRTTIKKTNKILDNADDITEGISGPITAVSSLLLGAKATSLLTVARFVKNFISGDRDDDKRHRRE
jgi:hypothetical protein